MQGGGILEALDVRPAGQTFLSHLYVRPSCHASGIGQLLWNRPIPIETGRTLPPILRILKWRHFSGDTAMKPVFDILEETIERIREYLSYHGHQPSLLLVSPGSYRRLLELNAQDPLALTPIAGLTVIIDEVLPETEVIVAG